MIFICINVQIFLNNINKNIQNTNEFINVVQKARNDTIKIKTRTEHTDELPPEITNLITNKNNIRKRWQIHRRQKDRIRLRDIDKYINGAIKDFRHTKWQKTLSDINPMDNSL